MQDLSKISVVLPSLDPDEKLNAVIDGLLEYGFSNIILVNDGSKQENLHYFTDAAAAHPEIHLLHHEVNRGKGAALKTAFRWFLDNCPEGAGVVTVDGEDRFEIIAAFSKIFADQKVNIENLKALMPEEEKRALLVFEISLPMEIDRNALRRTLKDKARTLGLQLSMQHRDIFEALHRVQPV